MRDFFDPPKTVIGEFDTAVGDAVAALYEGLPGEVFRVPIPVAEMTKYADNAFHALKIGFANELGAICHALGVDSHQVMDVFLADRKLNISSAYLRPGFAFGGSCLPKDLRGLVYAARRADVSVPLLATSCPPTRTTCSAPSTWSTATGKRRVGPVRAVVQTRTPTTYERARWSSWPNGSSARVTTFASTTPTSTLSRLIGANREYIETRLPHLGELLEQLGRRGARRTPKSAWSAARIPAVLAALAAAGRPHGDRPRPPPRRRNAPGTSGIRGPWLVER